MPYLTQGVLLCLGGLGFYLLWRRPFSESSKSMSEDLERELADLKSWKRTVSAELESQFERIRTIAGRVDREKRKQKEAEAPPGDAAEAQAEFDPLQDQSKLNRILAERFHGGAR